MNRGMMPTKTMVVSLTNAKSIALVFRRLARDTKARQDTFTRIAHNLSAQRQILTLLEKYPRTGSKVVLELAKDFNFRRKLLKIAG